MNETQYMTDKKYLRTAFIGLALFILVPIGLFFLSEFSSDITNYVIIFGIIGCCVGLGVFRIDKAVRGLF